ncbi:MAG: RIP metalloprotease RseP [Tissierellaceae bacterium]|nr:RIP metalloprotease RseP [Tissierellaceae bacterium]
MLTAISAIFVFLMVILVHEFGHFAVAKLVGIKVNEFSIGMGPKLLQNQRGETKYTLRLLPIGGYVKMEGEDEISDDPRGFSNVPVLARIGVVSAGAIMNFILAILLFSIITFGVGTPTTTIENPITGYPAEQGGLLPGDTIIEINETKINNWDSIVDSINSSDTDENLKIVVERNGELQSFNIIPIQDEDRVIIGIEPMYKKSVLIGIKGGFEKTYMFLTLMIDFFASLFKGKVGIEHLSGPVGVIHEVGAAARLGIYNLLLLLGFISVNLGFFNLLPIPALDGSRIVFLIIELIRGKPIDPEKEGFIHFIGFVLLISLMLLVTYRDIVKFKII